MPDRAYLHQLVDSIPEDLLENAQRVLEYLGIGPLSAGTLPQERVEAIQRRIGEQLPQADTWETLREKMRQGREASVRRRRALWGSDVEVGMQGDGAMSQVQGHDHDGALLLLTLRQFRGRTLEIAERISVSSDGGSLVYHQDLTGPDGTRSHHEAQFPIG